MAKGNVVTVRYKDGAGVASDLITADRAGRKIFVSVEKDSGITWLVIETKTRGGSLVDRSTYRLDEVVSYTESRTLEDMK